MSNLIALRERVRGEYAAIETAVKQFDRRTITELTSRPVNHGSEYSGSYTNTQREFFRQYKYWIFVTVHHIAKRCASQQLRVARVMGADPNPERPQRASELFTKDMIPDRVKAGTSLAPTEAVELLDNHPIIDLMTCPNPVQTRWEFTYFTIANYLLTGQAYWVADVGADGKPFLWAVPSTWVHPRHINGMFTGYKIRLDEWSEGIDVPPEQVVRIYLPDPSDVRGVMSPVWSQMAAIRIDQHIQNSQIAAFENGIFPNVVVKVHRCGAREDAPRMKLEPWQRKQLIETIREVWGGISNYGDPAILDGFIESIEELGRAPREMDWSQSGDSVKKRIFQAFGLNPIQVGEMSGANRAQAVMAERHEALTVINPLLEQLSVAMTAFLGPLFNTNQRIIVWWEPAKPRDDELDIKRWDQAQKSGLVRGNEFRVRQLGLPPEDFDRSPMMSNPGMLNVIGGLLEKISLGTVGADSVRLLIREFLNTDDDYAAQVVNGTASLPKPEPESNVDAAA